jgi:hypothetical protein
MIASSIALAIALLPVSKSVSPLKAPTAVTMAIVRPEQTLPKARELWLWARERAPKEQIVAGLPEEALSFVLDLMKPGALEKGGLDGRKLAYVQLIDKRGPLVLDLAVAKTDLADRFVQGAVSRIKGARTSSGAIITGDPKEPTFAVKREGDRLFLQLGPRRARPGAPTAIETARDAFKPQTAPSFAETEASPADAWFFGPRADAVSVDRGLVWISAKRLRVKLAVSFDLALSLLLGDIVTDSGSRSLQGSLGDPPLALDAHLPSPAWMNLLDALKMPAEHALLLSGDVSVRVTAGGTIAALIGLKNDAPEPSVATLEQALQTELPGAEAVHTKLGGERALRVLDRGEDAASVLSKLDSASWAKSDKRAGAPIDVILRLDPLLEALLRLARARPQAGIDRAELERIQKVHGAVLKGLRAVHVEASMPGTGLVCTLTFDRS